MQVTNQQTTAASDQPPLERTFLNRNDFFGLRGFKILSSEQDKNPNSLGFFVENF